MLHVISLIFALAAHGQEKQALPTTIATGTEWETPVYYLDSGKEGPTVLITGGIHGNESAGAFAADQIRHWPVTQGKLIVIPRVNQQALDAGERRIPNSAPEISDLNRNFPKTGEPNEARTELAKIVWAVVKSQKPDWVIDLHEGFAINRQNPKSVGSSILCSPNEATLPIFEHALAVVNASIDDPDDLFVLKSDTMTANGSLVRASMERLGAVGAILETTYKGVPLAVRIRQHRLMVHRILRNLKMIENAPSDLVFKKPEDKLKYIAIYQDGGVGGNGSREIRERLESEPEKYTTRIVSGADIREGTLDDFDAVIFPGGSGRKESASLQQEGLENVREFISDGGVYVGVCAGCYLACENFSWSLKILDAKTLPGKWKRGRASLDLEFSDVLPFSEMGLKSNKAKVTYINGPVMAPANSGAIPDFETVAIFKTETAKNGSPKGIQINSPAILRGQFGKGRVIGISPHPEQSDGLRDVLPRLLEWGLEN
ncbi:MAG: succinylglutamate desuccinylase/aspartoacylase family protein [Verrucomicrobiota bacterium]